MGLGGGLCELCVRGAILRGVGHEERRRGPQRAKASDGSRSEQARAPLASVGSLLSAAPQWWRDWWGCWEGEGSEGEGGWERATGEASGRGWGGVGEERAQRLPHSDRSAGSARTQSGIDLTNKQKRKAR